MRMKILCLEGWSPGAFPFVVNHYRNDDTVEFLEPSTFCPASPCCFLHCVNPGTVLLFVVAYVVVLMLAGSSDVAQTVAVMVCGILAARMSIAISVRFALWHAVWLAQAVIEEHRPDLLIGFSWGGAVAWELIASRKWSGPSILLAPTVSIIARWACTGAATVSLAPATAAQCHVFHAGPGQDPFCPDEQHTYMSAAGCVTHVYQRESHVLRGREVVADILEAVEAARALLVPSSTGGGAL